MIVAIKKGPKKLKSVVNYVRNADKADPAYYGANGCSVSDPVTGMNLIKMLHKKTPGIGYEHIVLAYAPWDCATESKISAMAKDIMAFFSDYQSFWAVHTNTDYLHILPKDRNKKKRPVLDEQQTRDFLVLLETKPWDEDVKRMIKVLLYTGMRCGECLALSWEDIDFENMTISINHNLADVGGKHYLTTPKTESSIRTIGMSEVLADILKEQKKYIEELSAAIGSGFAHPEMVFTSALGNYRDRNSLNTSFKRFLKGTGYEFLTLHQLRHCNATLLLNSGIDLKIVSEHLGHCDIGVTANIYADVLKSTKTKVADLISLKLS